MERKKSKRNIEKMIDQRAPEWLDFQIVRLGKDDTQLIETGKPGILWARLDNGKPIRIQVGIANVPSRFDLHLVVGRRRSQPKIWHVIYTLEDYDDPAGGGELTYHHKQHEEAGADRVNLSRKQIKARTVRVKNSADFTVQVFGDEDLTPNGWQLIPNKILDLSSHVPTEGAVFVGIESDNDGALSLHVGTGFAAPRVGTPANYPVPDAGKYPIARVLLFEGQTTLLNEHITISMPPSHNPANPSTVPTSATYDDISDNDPATNVTGAELEELTDGSETTLHSHEGVGGSEPMVMEDLTSQIPAVDDHFDLLTEAVGGNLLLFWNGVHQQPSMYDMDVDNLGLTTDFSPEDGDTLVAVYGVGSVVDVTVDVNIQSPALKYYKAMTFR